MKVLFLTYDFPFPTTSGGKVRAYNLLKYASNGVEIYLYSFVRKDFSEENIAHIQELGINNIEVTPRRKVADIRNLPALVAGGSFFKSLYYDKKVASRIETIIRTEKIDILHCESFYTSFYIADAISDLGVKQIYGSENIEHILYEDYIKHNVSTLLKPGYLMQAKKIKQEEERIIRAADMTLAVTDKEKKYFQNLSKKKVSVIENGVSLKEFTYKERQNTDKKTILFVGNFNYFPNYDAVMFFYDVFKKLTGKKLIFSIVGQGSSQFKKFADPAIQTTEYIKDIKDAYYTADIFVSPIAIGGGTNFKILEAMATGLPVVTFAERVREIGAENERDVLVGDNFDTFQQQVQRLLDDERLAKNLAMNARKIIEEKYSWDVIGKNLRTVWKELL